MGLLLLIVLVLVLTLQCSNKHVLAEMVIVQLRHDCFADAFEQLVLEENDFGVLEDKKFEYLSIVAADDEPVQILVETLNTSTVQVVSPGDGCVDVGGGTSKRIRFGFQNCEIPDKFVICDGKVPSEASNLLDKVEFLKLSEPLFETLENVFLRDMVNVKIVDLSDNGLVGTIPKFLVDLPSLEMLNLDGNQFTGCIPVREQTNSFLKPNETVEIIGRGTFTTLVNNETFSCSQIAGGFEMEPRSLESMTVFDATGGLLTCTEINVPGIDSNTIVLAESTLCGANITDTVSFFHQLGASGVILIGDSSPFHISALANETMVCMIPQQNAFLPHNASISMHVAYEKVDGRIQDTQILSVQNQASCGALVPCNADSKVLRGNKCNQCGFLVNTVGAETIIACYVAFSCIVAPLLLTWLFVKQTDQTFHPVGRRILKLVVLVLFILGGPIFGMASFQFVDDTTLFVLLNLPLEGLSMQPHSMRNLFDCMETFSWMGNTVLAVPGLLLFSILIQIVTPREAWCSITSADRHVHAGNAAGMRISYGCAWLYIPLICLAGRDLDATDTASPVRYIYFVLVGFCFLCFIYTASLANSLNYGMGTIPGQAERQRNGYLAEKMHPVEPMVELMERSIFMATIVAMLFGGAVVLLAEDVLKQLLISVPSTLVALEFVFHCTTLRGFSHNPAHHAIRLLALAFAFQAASVDGTLFSSAPFVNILVVYLPYLVAIAFALHKIYTNTTMANSSSSSKGRSILGTESSQESLIEFCENIQQALKRYRRGVGFWFSSSGAILFVSVIGLLILIIAIEFANPDILVYVFVGVVAVIGLVYGVRGQVVNDNGFMQTRFGRDEIKLIKVKDLVQFACEFYRVNKRVPSMQETSAHVPIHRVQKEGFTFVSHRWFNGSELQADSPDGALTRAICSAALNHEYILRRNLNGNLSARDLTEILHIGDNYSFKDLGFDGATNDTIANQDFVITTEWIWVDTHCVDQTSSATITKDIQNIPNVLLQAADAIAFTHDITGYQGSFWCGVEAAFLNHFYYMRARNRQRLQQFTVTNLESFRDTNKVINLNESFLTSADAFTFQNVQNQEDVETLLSSLSSPLLQLNAGQDRTGFARYKILRMLADVYNVFAVVSTLNAHGEARDSMPLFTRYVFNPAFPRLVDETQVISKRKRELITVVPQL